MNQTENMRINKYLAQCGLGSRRAVEELIKEGSVAINGRPVLELATQVRPEKDKVTVKGRPVQLAARHVYLMLNKPVGYDVTRGDHHHHRRAYDLLPSGTHPSVQAVGRLDRNSTGLLLFTNDGQMAFRLTHPRHGCQKVYEVEVEGAPDSSVYKRLLEGVELEDGPAHAVAVNPLPIAQGAPALLRIVMDEGRKRIVRRLCEAVGHPVLALHRTQICSLKLGNLPTGKTRPLTPMELKRLRQEMGDTPAQETERGGKHK